LAQASHFGLLRSCKNSAPPVNQAMELSPASPVPVRKADVSDHDEKDPRTPLAFDVPVRSPKKADAMTPGRLRLEAYSSSPIAGVPTPNTPNRQLRKEILAEQAREANAKKREISDRIKAEQEKATEAKRREIERDLEEKQQRREAKLLEVSSPKGRQVNLADLREKEAQATVDLKSKIEEDLNKAQEKATAAIADRGSRAGQHNEAVAAKRTGVLQRREEEMQKQKGLLEKDLEVHVQKAEEQLRDKQQKASHSVEKARNVAERHRCEEQKQADSKRQSLEGDMVEKEEKRKEALAGRGAKASQHNEVVAAKCAEMLQADEAQKKAASLNANLDAHAIKAEARIASRSERAGQHNEKVAERKLSVQHNQEERQKEILTKWEQKTGSKVPGEPFSRVERGSTGTPAGFAVAQEATAVEAGMAPASTVPLAQPLPEQEVSVSEEGQDKGGSDSICSMM